MSEFKWTEKSRAAAAALADGQTRAQAAAAADITDRQLYRWLNNPEFAAEVDQLTLLTGIAVRAERLRIIKRIVRQKVGDDGPIPTEKDILDWLKFAQSETNGTDILEQLVASIANHTPATE